LRDRYWLYVVLGCASAGPAARKRKALGLEGIGGKSVPMIDRLHRLMALWKEGEIAKVD
jgi:hypothetical protein